MHDARDRAGRVALCNMLRGLFRWHFMAAGVHEELEGCNPESKRKLSAAVTLLPVFDGSVPSEPFHASAGSSSG